MDFSRALDQYRFTTELHAHSFPVSACASLRANEVVEAYVSKNVNSLVITNHLNPLWIDGSPKERAEEYLSDYRIAREAAKNDINVILGVEIRFPENDNDYLVYGACEEDIEHFISLIPYGIESFYKEVKRDNNLILQAHPFRKGMVLAPLSSIDGIESMNMHPSHDGRPAIAFRYAKENRLIVSGGSDFHHKGNQALCLMRTENEIKTSYDVAKALTSKEAIFDCSGHIIIPYMY